MKTLLFVLLLTTSILASRLPCDDGECSSSFMELVTKYGYPAEEHFVTTADGYILRVFRLKSKHSATEAWRGPVILQHGFSSSAEMWILNDPDLSIGYYLADQGFDVWMNNNRGNKYSRNHTKLNPDKDAAAFFNYSFADFALYDQPAVFAYVNNKTNATAKYGGVSFLGHSQGTAQMFAALADRVEPVTSLMKHCITMGPVVYVNNLSTVLLRSLAWLYRYIDFGTLADWFGIHEVDKFTLETSKQYAEKCQKDMSWCLYLQTLLTDLDPSVLNEMKLPHYNGHNAGSSMKSIIHLSQLVRDPQGRFRKFDYGKKGNLAQYGTSEPPLYDLTSIDVKIHMIVGAVDRLVILADTERLRSQLKNSDYHVYDEGHVSFYLGKKMDHVYKIAKILSS